MRLLLAVAALALSQTPRPRQDVTFNLHEVEGTRLEAADAYIAPPPRPNFPRIFKVRMTFAPELAASVDHVR